MTETTRDILYSDPVIDAIRYAYDTEVTMLYVVSQNGDNSNGRYTNLMEILTTTPIENIDVDDIGNRLIVKPNNRNDAGLRIIFAYILNTVNEDDPNVNVNEVIKDIYRQYSDILGITGISADMYGAIYNEQLARYQSPDADVVFEDIERTYGVLIRGYQNEWRNRLLSSDDRNEDEEADYESKFGQSFKESIQDEQQGYYSTVDRLPMVSPPRYNKAIYTATAVMDDQTGLTEEGEALDGYALFNIAQVSEDIPLVLYVRDDNEKYYKILDGFVVTPSINEMFIRPFESASAVLQREPLVVERSGGRGKGRIREEVTSQYNDTNTMQYIYRYGNNYINVILYLETRAVRINVYSGELQGIERIGDITVAGLTSTNIEGKFDIYGDHMPPFVIEDIMTTNIQLSKMFDVVEITDIIASHQTPSYVYQYPYIEDVTQLNMSITPPSIRFSVENSYVTGPEYDDSGVQIPVGTAKTTVQFHTIESTVELDRFMIFMRLFAAYTSNIQYHLFDEYYEVTGVSYPNYTRVSTLESRSILKSRRPDIFIDGYSTVCQSDRQPQIITQEEYDNLTKRVKDTSTLIFPRSPVGDVDDQIILYCPDAKIKYPTLKRNPLINRDRFPVLPCCQSSNSRARQNTIDYYNATGQYSSDTASVRDDLVILHTLQILPPGAVSEVLRTNVPSLYNVLGLSGGTAVKVGVVQDNDAFISACAYLLDDPTLTRDVILSDPWHSSLVAQECYDDSNPRQTLENPDTIFDDRYYRIIETLYDITIYVMHHNNNNIEFKLPRHLSPYVRNYRNNGCILILETIDQDRVNYEPLMYRTVTIDETGNETIRDTTILNPQNNSTIFHEYYMRSVGTVNGDSTYVPLNLPTEGALGQLIDRDGKMRGVAYNTHSIILEPCQPLDLPAVTIDNMTTSDSLQYIRDMFPDVELDFSGRYSGLGINGVWYTVQDIQCFSLVSDSIRELSDIPIVTKSVPYIDVTSDYDWYDFIYSYETQRATLNVILDFIYHVYYYNGQSESLFYIEDEVQDSIDDYTIDRIPHDISRELTLEQAASLNNIVRLIDGQYRIYLYSRQFADGVIYHVNRLLSTNVTPVTTLAIPPLNYSIDYNIYRGDEQYTTWLDLTDFSLKQHQYIPTGYTSIYPYIYTKNSMYFIIQPVSSQRNLGEARATYVSSMWRKTRINYGYTPDIPNIQEIDIGAPTEIVNGQIVNIYSDFFTTDSRVYAILPFEDLDETVIIENRRAEEYRVWQGQNDTETTTRVISKRGGRGRGRGRASDTGSGPRGGTVIRGRRGRGRPRGRRGRRTADTLD